MTPERFEHLDRALTLLPRQYPSEEGSAWRSALRALIGEAVLSGTTYAITALDVTASEVTVTGDQVDAFMPGRRLAIAGSTANDGTYVSARARLVSGNTVVQTEEPLQASAALGMAAPYVATGLQEIEEVLWMLRQARSLSTARGKQLEGVGEILGLIRGAASDDAYHDMLVVQAAVNAASGAPEELIAIGRLLTGVTKVLLTQLNPATVIIFLFGSQVPIPAVRALYQRAAAAGVTLVLETSASQLPAGFRDTDGDGVTDFDDVEAFPSTDWFEINLVTVGSKQFRVTGNASSAAGVVVAGDQLRVVGSTANDGLYTVVTSTFSTPNTTITVNDTIPSSTADGYIVPSTAAEGDLVEVLAS